jgi:hypothetical protein
MNHQKNHTEKDGTHEHFSRNLVFPVLDSTLHPNGTWQAKQYTKRLVSNLLKVLSDNDHCIVFSNDFP